MMLYESVLRLIDATSFSPDTVLLIFANVVLLFELLHAAIYAFGIWLTFRVLDWLFERFLKRKKP